MKIKEIYIESYGPYRNWSFRPNSKGVHMIYGSNESGKTSLLQAFRRILFGVGRKEEPVNGHMRIEREGREYFIGRKDKTLTFYEVGGESFHEEPSDLWWQGLDKKTFDKVFAITLDDLQGAHIIHEVDVRTRFFGAEGGEALGQVVKHIDEEASKLLVASAAGKRTINTLLERLRQDEEEIHRLGRGEEQYKEWQLALERLVDRERAFLEQRQERKEYLSSVELVLRGWDTYKRSEEARHRMHQFHQKYELEREAFLNLDEEIRQCQEYMRIWRGKEEGLLPENFDPDDLLGTYERDIEGLYEELSKWTQLEKECAQGEEYLEKVRQRLAYVRAHHAYWKDEELPAQVNWYDGERAARQLRSAREAYQVWKQREPFPQEEAAKEVLQKVESLEEEEKKLLDLQQVYESDHKEISSPVEDTQSSYKIYYVGAALCVGVGLVALLGYLGANSMALAVAFFVLGGVLAFLGYRKGKGQHTDEDDASLLESSHASGKIASQEEYEQLSSRMDAIREELAKYREEVGHYQAYVEMKQAWMSEGKELEQQGTLAMDNWQEWLPTEAKPLNRDDDFYKMKEEYDGYMASRHELEGYEKRMAQHREQLESIVQKGRYVWQRLSLQGEPTIVEVRVLYNRLQSHKQNRVRWEQKEWQRKNYRDEYAQWSKKEKDLLLAQDELIHRAGVSSAAEYRQELLAYDQYKQWETIYAQSQKQLDLLIPKGSHGDLLYRRLQGNDKHKWESEYKQSEEELQKLEMQLAALYEERGTLQESMRQLSTSHQLSEALLKKEQTEEELREALEDWMTYVFIHHGVELAQKEYESLRQPAMLARASSYVQTMTGGIYTLHLDTEESGVYVKDTTGRLIPSSKWSSGLGDQVYLALRLSLAQSFEERIEGLPLILDDILVRFDLQRQSLALDVLEQLGENSQIFLFTCHEPTWELKTEGFHRYRLGQDGMTSLS